MSAQVQTAASPPFEDRRTGLIVFGAIQILIGVFCALMIPLVLLSLFVPQPGGPPMSVRTVAPAMAQYALMAVVAIWLGIGSIRARRWARALTLVLAWIGLICGLAGLLFFSLFMGDMYQQIAREQKLAPEAVVVMQAVSGGLVGCIYVFLPAVFILFYQSRHVRATCEVRDPQVRWTDKCPLPVLAVSLLLGLGAFSMIWVVAFAPVFPWFGVLLEGPAAVALFLVSTLLFALLAWGTYKLRIWAWLATIVLMAFFSVSSIVTFSRVGMLELFRKMDFPKEQLEIIEKFGILEKMNMPWMMGITLAVYLAYLLYVGRYFFSSPTERRAA